MDYRHNVDGDTCEIQLQGSLTHHDKDKYDALLTLISNDDIKHVNINFEEVDYIDSTALGVLQLMRGATLKSDKDLILQHPQGQVKKAFEVTMYYDLFRIED